VDQFIGESTSSFETQILNARRYNITPEQSRQALGKCPTRRASSPWFIFVGNGFFPQFSEGAWTKLKRRISLHKSDRSNLLNPSVLSVDIKSFSELSRDFLNLLL
jgi:hypothetical protein